MSGCAADGACLGGGGDARFRRVLWAALAANAAMFLVELVASFVSGSVALQADALDFLGDAANYGISLFVLGMSLRARATAAMIKGATMALFGLWVIGNAVYRLAAGVPPDAAIMGGIGALALAVNVGIAITLFRYRAGDSNMRSIWLCSRNDVLANLSVLLAAGGVAATGAAWPDLVVAAGIAALCLSSASQIYRQARAELRLGHGRPEVVPR